MSEKSLDEKKAQAHKIVAAAAAGSLATAVIPIPVADMFPLIGEQFLMLSSITATFGFKVSKAVLTTLIYSAISVSGATFLGKTAVSSLLKAVPLWGTAAGTAISAGTAGALTTFIGEVYIKLMVWMSENEVDSDYLKTPDALKRFKELAKAEEPPDTPAPDKIPDTPAPDVTPDTPAPDETTDAEPPRWIIRFEE